MARNKTVSIVVVTLGCLLAASAFGQGAGTISTVAGTGSAGYSGDNGPAINAALSGPPFVALDQAGNIYIADQNNNRIRKVDLTGKITTFAGTGVQGYNGDSQPATSAQLNAPCGVFADLYGNVYINDPGNQRIRKVDTNGMISTVAGIGVAGYNGDGINATNASLYNAVRVVADPAGNLYIADQSNHRIRKVAPNGIITTIAGTGVGTPATGSYNGDGPAASTNLNNPTAVALDAAGNVYFADQFNHRIREIAGGQVITLAGTGTPGYNGDGAPLSTQLNFPGALIVDPAGTIYFADDLNQRVRKISADRSKITTIAGTGSAGYNGDSIPAINAELNATFGIGLDASGNLYLADSANNRIRKIVSGASAVGTVPVITSQGIGNAASFALGITPGGLVTVFGAGVANGANGSVTAPAYPLPTELAGVVVIMGGLPAPIYSVYNVGGQQQVSVQVPYELAGQSSVPVTVLAQGAYSAPATISLLAAQPGIFVYGGTNAIATHNADGSLVTASSPAVPGEVVIVYMTGLGAVNPPVPTGVPAPLSPLSQTTNAATVTLGGVSAPVIFSGLAPTFAGLYQIDITVPSNAPAGNQNLIVTLNGVQSNTATLAAK